MYNIIQIIGQGSYGKVYLLKSSHYQYALKVEERCKHRDDENRGDKLLLKLCHAHLVRCWNAFLYNSRFYYVLELCSFGSLDEYLTRQKRLLPQECVLTWFVQTADVLRYLHVMKILHRDIKPANIFLDENKNIKVGDLGVSRKLEFTLQQAETSNAGTLPYMSPELLEGNPYNLKADIWSLGCCVHEMMTLVRTFNGQSMKEIFDKIITLPIPKLPDLYEERLQELVFSLFSRDPSRRPDALDILYHLSVIKGEKIKLSSLGLENDEIFNQKQICKAVERFESSKSTKIIPLKVNFESSDSDTQLPNSFQNVKDTFGITAKSLRKKKHTALENELLYTDDDQLSVFDEFKLRLAIESIQWLQKQNESYSNWETSEDAYESYPLTLSTRTQSAFFVNKKTANETKYDQRKIIPKTTADGSHHQLNDVAKSMMILCQGQSQNLTEMMLERVMGQQ